GQAAEYEIRYMTVPMTEALWDSATIAPVSLAPAKSGEIQHVEISGFDWGKWYFALKTADEVPNWSDLSNIVSASIGDTTAPGVISDLSVFSFDETGITLTWSASGDDGYNGRANEYDLRHASAAISEETWAMASRIQGLPAPDSSGIEEMFVITGLETGQQYFFAIKTRDERANESELSNIVSGTPLQDTVPPGQVTDLSAIHAVGHSATLTWTAPGNNGFGGMAFEYDLRYSQTAITEESWDETTQVQDVSSPVAAGRQESFTIHDLELETPYFFALKTADDLSNWSEISNVVSSSTIALSQLTHSLRKVGAQRGCWSPNGHHLFFEADFDIQFNSQIYTMPANGGEPKRLTYEPSNKSDVVRTPDGNQLTFLAGGNDLNELRVVDPIPGSISSLLLRHDGLHIMDYSWSPDGNYIVYTAYPYSQNDWDQRKCYVVSAFGGAPEVLLSEDWLPNEVVWSPVGNQICFVSEHNESYDIWVMSTAGENPTQLTFDPAEDRGPAWSPDGSQIAFASNRSGIYDIWIMSATGENQTQLTFDLDAEIYPQWSPDGKAICYTGAVPAGFSWQSDIWVLHLE
ncbi:MAG: hypothetical protein KJ927_02595, partial [Candidatus Eisenbacteria bacterium]|nr:hypothetical protein [Candidatus Eisenbacteria bacterium]